MSKFVMGRLSEEEKSIVKKMREDGNSYGEIASVLNCTRYRVRDYCQDNNMNGFNKRNYGDPLKHFLENLKNKTNGNLEYIEGYENCDSKVKLKCLKCNNIYVKNAQFVRKNKEYLCGGCIKIKNEIKQKENKKDKESKEKIRREIREQKRIERDKIKNIECASECIECSAKFIGERRGLIYCSSECKRKRSNRISYETRQLRYKNLIKDGKFDKSISLTKLIKRDKNICAICGKEVDLKDLTDINNVFVAGDNYPSVDHIKPISKGGTHTWDNIQLAHRYCNTIKSDNDYYENEYNQLTFSL